MDKREVQKRLVEIAKKNRDVVNKRRKLLRLAPLSLVWPTTVPPIRLNIHPAWNMFTETTRPKDCSRFYDAHMFTEALKAKGYENIGSGGYSTVMAKPGSDRVIKVVRHPDNDGWVDYIKWSAEKGYAGTFAPKVFSYKYVKSKGNPGYPGFGLAVMERMAKTVYRAKHTEDVRMVERIFDTIVHGDNKLAMTLADLVLPGLDKFAIDLREKYRGSLDLHGGNSMVRANGSFCVTDPVCGHANDNPRARFRSAERLAA